MENHFGTLPARALIQYETFDQQSSEKSQSAGQSLQKASSNSPSSSPSRTYMTSSTYSSPSYSPSVAANQSPVSRPAWSGEAVPAAIQTYHTVEYRDVPITPTNIQPTIIEVGSHSLPVTILFRSTSSTLNVQQMHQGSAGTNQETASEDEPHILRHSVKKPIYQEIREIISPYRKIFQNIEPVQQEIKTIVARNQNSEKNQNIVNSQSFRKLSNQLRNFNTNKPNSHSQHSLYHSPQNNVSYQSQPSNNRFKKIKFSTLKKY